MDSDLKDAEFKLDSLLKIFPEVISFGYSRIIPTSFFRSESCFFITGSGIFEGSVLLNNFTIWFTEEGSSLGCWVRRFTMKATIKSSTTSLNSRVLKNFGILIVPESEMRFLFVICLLINRVQLVGLIGRKSHKKRVLSDWLLWKKNQRNKLISHVE